MVTALATLNLPTGHQSPLNPGNLGTDSLGGGSLAVTLGVNLSKWVNPVNLYANVWYGVPTSFQKHGEDRLTGPILRPIHGQDRVTVNLAAEWVLTPRWAILLEFYSLWEVGADGVPQRPGGPPARPGVYHLPPMFLGPGSGPGPGGEEYRLLLHPDCYRDL